MQNKKLEWKRVILFFILSYLIAYIPEFILSYQLGNIENWTDPKLAVLLLFITYSPALAVVLTRVITKEGWKDSYLHLNDKGNLKYYLLSVFYLTITGIGFGMIINLMTGKSILQGFSLMRFTGTYLYTTALSVPLGFVTFGEELGWRGYLYPKLEKLIGMPLTIIIGGIVWGLWHAPLTAKGHNFGTDYPGFPYTGMLLMSIYCIATGAFLMWLVKKTNSVWISSIAHSVNNNAISAIGFTIAPEIQEGEVTQIQSAVVLMSFQFVICMIFMIFLIKSNKNQNLPAES
ncbi:MAG: CPBP family intramembrane metalloprotease [Oscillospiraceae bacterium]|nr:CPBP family intramembrane metalloprotease [Oscillospiraceae bacterium]